MTEEVAELRAEVRRLSEIVRALQQEATPEASRDVRLARKAGDSNGVFQPLIFLTGNGDDRQSSSHTTAQILSDPQLLAFKQDGIWFSLGGNTSDSGELAELSACLCALKAVVQSNLSLSDEEQQSLAESCHSCDVGCGSYTDGLAPPAYDLTLSGVTGTYSALPFPDAQITEECLDRVVEAINTTHRLEHVGSTSDGQFSQCKWERIVNVQCGADVYSIELKYVVSGSVPESSNLSVAVHFRTELIRGRRSFGPHTSAWHSTPSSNLDRADTIVVPEAFHNASTLGSTLDLSGLDTVSLVPSS